MRCTLRHLGHLLLGLALCSVALAADGAEKPILVLDAGGHTAVVTKVLFMPDGRELITVSGDNSIRVWDVATGQPLRVLRPPIGVGPGCTLNSAALSPDGRTLAVGSVWRFGEIPIYLIDLATGRILRVLRGHTTNIVSLAFSADGARLASGSHDRASRIWDVATGKCEWVLEGHDAVVMGVAFAPDGRHLATASYDKTGRIWSVADGRCEAVLRGHEKEVQGIAWRPDGRVVATGGHDGSIRQWSTQGSAFQGFERLGGAIFSLTFSADSQTLLFTRGLSSPFACSVLDLATGAERVRFDRHNNSVQDGTLSPDGGLAATTGGNDHETFIWRVADAAVVHRLAGGGRSVLAVAWSPDGESLAWGNTNRFISHNDCGPLERTFRLADLELSGGVSPNDRRAAPTIGTLRAEFAGTALVVREGADTVGTIKIANPRDRILSFTLLPRNCVALGADSGLLLFDARTGKQLRTFLGHSGAVFAVAPSPDGRFLLSGSIDQTFRVWDPNRDEPVLSVFVAGDAWIAWTPEGYYAASPGGEQLMGWQVSNGPDSMASYYPASQFRETLYRPDVIKRLLRTGSLTKALAEADAAAGKSTRRTEVADILPPRVSITDPTVAKLSLNGNSLEVKAVASSVGNLPVTTLRLLLDGRPAPEGLKIFTEPKLGEVGGRWTVEVPPGSHRLTVQASNGISRAVSEPPVEVVTVANGNPAATSSSLYALAIGINDYPDKKLKLDCAAPDAQALGQAFRTNSRSLFRAVEVKLLLNGEASRANILDGLQWLTRSAKTGDVAVVFYAGHGDSKIEGELYLIPADADIRDLKNTGILADSIRRTLGELPSTAMLIMDACFAGDIDARKRKKRGLPDQSDAFLRQLMYDSGVVVMCGASKEQEAAEEDGRGFFTRAIVEGLAGRADMNKDGLVKFNELDTYVTERVLELSGGEQEPTCSRTSLVRSFALSKP
jgi:WD40 repeat protein